MAKAAPGVNLEMRGAWVLNHDLGWVGPSDWDQKDRREGASAASRPAESEASGGSCHACGQGFALIA